MQILIECESLGQWIGGGGFSADSRKLFSFMGLFVKTAESKGVATPVLHGFSWDLSVGLNGERAVFCFSY